MGLRGRGCVQGVRVARVASGRAPGLGALPGLTRPPRPGRGRPSPQSPLKCYTACAVGTLLEVKNLKTHFVTRSGVVRAVDDVSWDVGESETVALVGESGCGKSVSALSIMRLVAGPSGQIVGRQVLLKGRHLLRLSGAEMR